MLYPQIIRDTELGLEILASLLANGENQTFETMGNKRLTEKELSDLNGLWFRRICKDSMEVTMAWTEITRRQYRRDGLLYASDMTDAEWSLIAPFMPEANPIGRPRETDLRALANAIEKYPADQCANYFKACGYEPE